RAGRTRRPGEDQRRVPFCPRPVAVRGSGWQGVVVLSPSTTTRPSLLFIEWAGPFSFHRRKEDNMTALKTSSNGAVPLEAPPGTPLLGEVITWNAGGVKVKHVALVEALRDAGLDEKVARELAPRHAFTRACRKLGEKRIIR